MVPTHCGALGLPAKMNPFVLPSLDIIGLLPWGTRNIVKSGRRSPGNLPRRIVVPKP